MSGVGTIINVVSFDPRKRPHITSILEKALWGFSIKHRNGWNLLKKGTPVLIYGDKGILMAGYVKRKCESHEPVKFWIGNPAGYPLHVFLELINKKIENIEPITREELVTKYDIPLAKKGFMGMSLVVFGAPAKRAVTYPLEKFERIWNDFMSRNNISHGNY